MARARAARDTAYSSCRADRIYGRLLVAPRCRSREAPHPVPSENGSSSANLMHAVWMTAKDRSGTQELFVPLQSARHGIRLRFAEFHEWGRRKDHLSAGEAALPGSDDPAIDDDRRVENAPARVHPNLVGAREEGAAVGIGH